MLRLDIYIYCSFLNCKFISLCFTLISGLFYASYCTATSLTLSLPSSNLFFIQRPSKPSIFIPSFHSRNTKLNNNSKSEIYVHNSCLTPYDRDVSIQSHLAERVFSLPLSSTSLNHQLQCSVLVKLAQTKVHIDRPYLDALVYRDQSWTTGFGAKHLRSAQQVCVTVQLVNSRSGASVASSCSFGPRDMFPQSCLIRQEIPFSWFELNSGGRKEHRSFDEEQQDKQLATVSYSIDTHCSSSQQFMLLTDQANVELISSDISSKLQSIELHSYRNEHITLLSPSNLSFTSNSMNALLIRYNRHTSQQLQEKIAEILPYSSPATHTNPILFAQTKRSSTTLVSNATALSLAAIRIRMWIDPKFEVISASPLESDCWEQQIETATNHNEYTIFTLRLLPKELETKGLKKQKENLLEEKEEYLFGLMLRLKKLAHSFNPEKDQSTSQSSEEQTPDTKEAVVYWSVKLFNDEKLDVDGNNYGEEEEKLTAQNWNHNNSYNAQKLSVTKFPIVDVDTVHVIVPVIKNLNLINTAIFSNTHISMPLRVFSITEGGLLQDVTSNSHCLSAETHVLKTSPICSSIYLDGSETQGSSKVAVHIQHLSLTASVHFKVWFAQLPVTIQVSDPVLNAIDGWKISNPKYSHQFLASSGSFKSNKKRRYQRSKRRSSSTSSPACHNLRRQQAEVRVLASFQVLDQTNSQQIYLTGDDFEAESLMLDITQQAKGMLQAVNSEIIFLFWHSNGKVFAIGKNPGSTRITLPSLHQQQEEYGSTSIVVSDERVSPNYVSVQVIQDAELKLHEKLPHFQPLASVFEISQIIHSRLLQQYQKAGLEVQITYSDGQMESLKDMDHLEYTLRLYSNADYAIKITKTESFQPVEFIAVHSLQPTEEAMLTVELHTPKICWLEASSGQKDHGYSSKLNAGLFASGSTNVWVRFQEDGNQLSGALQEQEDDLPSFHPLKMHSMLAICLIVLLLLTLLCLIGHGYSGLHFGLHNGYEKLVAPLLARLGSNQSISSASAAMNSGHDCVSGVSYAGSLSQGTGTARSKGSKTVEKEGNKEWIWLPRRQVVEYNASIGSRYSQRSTLGLSTDRAYSRESSSSSNNSGASNPLHKCDEEYPQGYKKPRKRGSEPPPCQAISYHGSEISVFLAPNQQKEAKVAVNADKTSDSWRRRCSTGEKRHLSSKNVNGTSHSIEAATSSGCFSTSDVGCEREFKCYSSELELRNTLKKHSKSKTVRQHSHSSSNNGSGTLRKDSLLMRHSSDRQYPDNNKSLPPVHSYERNKLLEEFAEDCSEHEYSLNYTSSPNVFPKTRRRTTECDDHSFNSEHRYSETSNKTIIFADTLPYNNSADRKLRETFA